MLRPLFPQVRPHWRMTIKDRRQADKQTAANGHEGGPIRTMRILIIGASGFLGRTLAAIAVDQGHHVLAALRDPAKETPGGRSIALGDVLGDPARIPDPEGIDAVIHAAGVINGSERELHEGNADLTRRVVAMMSACPRARLVYISSVSARNGTGAYGRSKRECERIIAQAGLDSFTIFRPSLLYGPGDTKNVGTLLRLVRLSPFVPVPGGNGIRLEPLHVDDLAGPILQAAAGRGREGHVYTVAGPGQIGLLDMLRLLSSAMGKRTLLVPIPLGVVQKTLGILDAVLPSLHLPVQQFSPDRLKAPHDCREAAADFGFAPRPFVDGVHTLIRPSAPAESR